MSITHCKICEEELATVCKDCNMTSILFARDLIYAKTLKTLGWLVESEMQKQMEMQGVTAENTRYSPEMQAAVDYYESIKPKVEEIEK